MAFLEMPDRTAPYLNLPPSRGKKSNKFYRKPPVNCVAISKYEPRFT